MVYYRQLLLHMQKSNCLFFVVHVVNCFCLFVRLDKAVAEREKENNDENQELSDVALDLEDEVCGFCEH